MARHRFIICGVCCAVLLASTVALRAGQTQDNAALDHAKQIFELLRAEKFGDVAKQFNAQVAAALSEAQLGQVWSTFSQQVGAFKSFIDQRVTTPAAGITAVVLGCQFEKAAVNVLVAFDADGKIGGLRFMPRQAENQQPAAPPASSHFKEEAVTVGSGEWVLPGTLSVPDGTIAAAVVLVHGSGPNDRDETLGPNKPFRDLAWGLADRGIAVLRYEKRTRRYAAKMAANQNLTVREETIDDALQAVAALRARKDIDPKRVFVLGHSLGGTLAPRIAADDQSLAGIIILAGATRPLEDVVRDQLTYLASLAPNGTKPEQGLEALKRSAPESYWKDLDAYKPAQTAAKLQIPMLILQGERDYQVTQADLQGWRDALGSHRDVTIKSYPTLNHLFMTGEGKITPAEYERASHIPDVVLDDIATWIKK
jgi:dienelactone hydrolase